MRKKVFVTLCASVFVVCFFAVAIAASGAAPSDERKHTSLGLYIDAVGAFQKWSADKEKVHVVDCRTVEEYVYLGHAAMAVNIPSRVWTGKWDSEKNDAALAENPEFMKEIQKRFKPDDVILVMCRSGHRSGPCVNTLAKAGFKNVFNVVDGFEGDKVKDKESYFDGKRMKNGWKNSGAPWTYDIKPELTPFLSK